MILSLPWPPAILSPNARAHHMARASVAKTYRQQCAWGAKAQGVRRQAEAGPVHVSLTFCPPDLRRRDLDNMLAAMKAGLDGLADALGVDDHHWTLTLQRGASVPAGLVRVQINQHSTGADGALVPIKGSIS